MAIRPAGGLGGKPKSRGHGALQEGKRGAPGPREGGMHRIGWGWELLIERSMAYWTQSTGSSTAWTVAARSPMASKLIPVPTVLGNRAPSVEYSKVPQDPQA